MAILKFVPDNTKIDFVRLRFVTFFLMWGIVCVSLLSYWIKDLSYGIDFKGGFSIEVRIHEKVNLHELREKLQALNLGNVSLQTFGSDQDFLVNIEQQKGKEYTPEQILEQVQSVLGDKVDYRRIETVGPTVGEELIKNSFLAFIFATLAMLVYMVFRFEWQYGICAVAALIHDGVGIVGFYSLFGLEFNETAIIAILITLGYSVNDTIVVFDRIRENLRKYKKMSLKELINKSLNETLSRTILTSFTTLLATIALYLFGGPVIATFSLPIGFGIVIGTLSSIGLATPLLLYIPPKRSSDLATEEAPALRRE